MITNQKRKTEKEIVIFVTYFPCPDTFYYSESANALVPVTVENLRRFNDNETCKPKINIMMTMKMIISYQNFEPSKKKFQHNPFKRFEPTTTTRLMSFTNTAKISIFHSQIDLL